MTSTCRSSVLRISLFVSAVFVVHGCGGSSKTGPGTGGALGSGGMTATGTGGIGPGGSGMGGTTTAYGGSGGDRTVTGGGIAGGGGTAGGGVVGGGGAAGATAGQGGKGGGVAGGGGASQGGSGGSTTSTCGTCVASTDGGPEGGGQTDAPLGGSGGNPDGGSGTGGIGTGGTTSTAQTGGAGGSTTPWTVPPGCGNAQLEPPERCDDGNTVPFDGCSSSCEPEPDCSGSSCTSKCGDGLLIGEDCDDGNTVDGDGCSSACKVEDGFTCAQPPLGDKIEVPAIYRDFKFHNPSEFEAGSVGSYSATTGMVKLDLDASGKPVLAGATSASTGNAKGFDMWYVDTDGVNHATASQLVLWSNGSGAYVNRYGANGEKWPVRKTASWCGYVGSELSDSSGNAIPCTYQGDGGQTDCDVLAGQGFQMVAGSCKAATDGKYQAQYVVAQVDGNPLFFPVDDDPFSASEMEGAQISSYPKDMYDSTGLYPWDLDAKGNKILHNFSFTSEIRYWFKYEVEKAYQLDIAGDDDVWVFVNKKLAVDLGGIHTPVQGSVTLNESTAPTYGLSAGKVYEIAVFHAERQTTSSTLKITLVGFNTAPSVCTRN